MPEGSEPGEAALYGIEFHAVMALALQGKAAIEPKDDFTAHVKSAFDKLQGWLKDNDWWRDGNQFHVEVSLAYCPRTATARFCQPPDSLNHIYADLRPDEIGGTADLIVVPEDKQRPILVLDHKTGIWGDFSRPERLAQLWVLAAAACLHFGRDRVVMAILHTPKDGVPIPYESEPIEFSTLAAGQLNRFRDQMKLVGSGNLRPGKHCKYCPVRSQCPAKSTDLLNEAGQLVERATLVGSELVLVANTNGNLTREEKLGRLHLLMARFRELDKRAVEEMKRAIKDDPGLEPVRPDGKTLGLKTRTIERISKKSILKALGPDEGEKMLAHLRDVGALEEHEEEILWAE